MGSFSSEITSPEVPAEQGMYSEASGSRPEKLPGSERGRDGPIGIAAVALSEAVT